MLHPTRSFRYLSLTRGDDGRHLRVLDLAASAAGGFNGFHNFQGGVVCNFAENDVFAVEPASDDGGDEKLGPVAVEGMVSFVTALRGSFVPCESWRWEGKEQGK